MYLLNNTEFLKFARHFSLAQIQNDDSNNSHGRSPPWIMLVGLEDAALFLLLEGGDRLEVRDVRFSLALGEVLATGTVYFLAGLYWDVLGWPWIALYSES